MIADIAASASEMEQLGEMAARAARAGDVFALVGDLGAGKTHWTKGFLRGLHFKAEVTSPTFGLIHEYVTTEFTVFHLDFYRIESEEELLRLGWDELTDVGGVIIVEWANKFSDFMPEHTRWLQFSILADGSRHIEMMGTSRS